MKLYDNTRLSDDKDCPRKFYWRHVRHIVPEGLAFPLVFGLSWHDAMDAVWDQIAVKQNRSDREVHEAGYKAFLLRWMASGYPLTHEMTEDQLYKANYRIPETAEDMLAHYIHQRRPFIEQVTLYNIERPFMVPLDADDPELMYVGRLDKEGWYLNGVYVFEHKTSSLYKKEGYFRSEFVEGFSPNSQIDGYLHAIHMEYGEKARGVYIDAALVHKTVHDGFRFIPIEKGFQMLDAWLFETKERIKKIEEQKLVLENEDSPNAPLMRAFPRNTNQCVGKYGVCPYINLCRMHANPLAIQPDELMGYTEDKWEPFDILGLAELGINKEETGDGELRSFEA